MGPDRLGAGRHAVSRRRIVWLAAALLAIARPAVAEEAARPVGTLDVPRIDGWYSWTAAASSTGARTCCYGWHGGRAVTRRVCDLDGKRGGHTIGGDCVLDSDEIRVYVRMRDGKPDRVRALNAECPVSTSSEIADLGRVESEASVRWLSARISRDRHDNAEILAAIPMHGGDAAFDALTSLLEDRRRTMELRKQALFWLVQSGSDDALAYVDRLLTRR